MGEKVGARARYLPRISTILVTAILAGLIFLANASSDTEWSRGYPVISYGWPMDCAQVALYDPFAAALFSRSRFAGNAAIWLCLLASTAGFCEWLMRRYRPRLRWSLRTMLLMVTVSAAFFGWFAIAYRRATVQDDLISQLHGFEILEYWGPRWLRLTPAARYFRYIVGATLDQGFDDEQTAEMLKRLRALPTLEVLRLTVDRLTPEVVDSLSSMSRLEVLNLENFDDEPLSNECLAAIGKQTRLHHLHLYGNLRGVDWQALGSLSRLRSLDLEFAHVEGSSTPSRSASFRCLPVLPRLERLSIEDVMLNRDDVSRLAIQPRLKSLCLNNTLITSGGFAALRALGALEELFIADRLSGEDLLSLRTLRGLTQLHLFEFAVEPEKAEEILAYRDARAALQKSNPWLVIDNDTYSVAEEEQQFITAMYKPDAIDPSQVLWLRRSFWRAVGSNGFMQRL